MQLEGSGVGGQSSDAKKQLTETTKAVNLDSAAAAGWGEPHRAE